MAGRDDLPGVLGEIAAAAGRPAALKLARDYGGTNIWLPKKPGPDTALARCVGQDAAQAIVAALGAGLVLIPFGPASAQERTAVAIRRLLAEGASAAWIARTVGCHVRTVYRHRRRLRAAEAASQRAVKGS